MLDINLRLRDPAAKEMSWDSGDLVPFPGLPLHRWVTMGMSLHLPKCLHLQHKGDYTYRLHEELSFTGGKKSDCRRLSAQCSLNTSPYLDAPPDA